MLLANNWLVGLLGTTAILISYLIMLLMVIWFVRCFRKKWPLRKNNGNVYYHLALKSFLVLIVFNVVFTFQSNTPKNELEVDDHFNGVAIHSEKLKPIKNDAPVRLTSKQSTAHLEKLRAEQLKEMGVQEK